MEGRRDENGLTLEEFLKEYDVSAYERPSVTVDAAVFTLHEVDGRLALAVLLIKRKNHPSMGMYALPGGFVEMNETLGKAALRELKEETGIDLPILRQFGTFGALDRDPRTRVISVGHYGVAPLGSLRPSAGDDAAKAGLFTVRARLTAVSKRAQTFVILLSGEENLRVEARLRRDAMGAVALPASRGTLASDHDHVLFCALCALANQPRLCIARLLAPGRRYVPSALLALESALGAIPKNLSIGL